jgi:hypothetical protein
MIDAVFNHQSSSSHQHLHLFLSHHISSFDFFALDYVLYDSNNVEAGMEAAGKTRFS